MEKEILLPTTLMAPRLPASSITDIPDVVLEDIFLPLPTAADLARASTARASFCRVIAGHAFLRRYRTLHPPPLLGVLEDAFIPAKSPHASAGAARAFADFDFSCSSFLPSTPGRGWTPFLARDLAVCDPVHRRYILLPAVPVDLKDLVVQADLLDLETFLAWDEEHPLSFRMLCLMQCKLHLLLLVFSSLDGQWHAHTFDQLNAQTTYASFTSSTLPGLENRQYVHGCFYWSFRFMHKLLMFDPCTMEFSAVSIPFVESCCTSFIIVESEKGMLGMLTRWYDEGIEDDEYCLRYCVMRNNQWYLEKVIPLLLQNVTLVGAAGGYLLMAAMYTTPSQENQSGYLLWFSHRHCVDQPYEANFKRRLILLVCPAAGRRSDTGIRCIYFFNARSCTPAQMQAMAVLRFMYLFVSVDNAHTQFRPSFSRV